MSRQICPALSLFSGNIWRESKSRVSPPVTASNCLASRRQFITSSPGLSPLCRMCWMQQCCGDKEELPASLSQEVSESVVVSFPPAARQCFVWPPDAKKMCSQTTCNPGWKNRVAPMGIPMKGSPALPKMKPRNMLEEGTALSGHPESIKKEALGVQVSFSQNQNQSGGREKRQSRCLWISSGQTDTWKHVHKLAIGSRLAASAALTKDLKAKEKEPTQTNKQRT